MGVGLGEVGLLWRLYGHFLCYFKLAACMQAALFSMLRHRIRHFTLISNGDFSLFILV